MAIEHVQDSTVSTPTPGDTSNLTFDVAPTTGDLFVVMIGGYNSVGPGSWQRPRTPPPARGR